MNLDEVIAELDRLVLESAEEAIRLEKESMLKNNYRDDGMDEYVASKIELGHAGAYARAAKLLRDMEKSEGYQGSGVVGWGDHDEPKRRVWIVARGKGNTLR